MLIQHGQLMCSRRWRVRALAKGESFFHADSNLCFWSCCFKHTADTLSVTKLKMRRYYVYGLLNCHQGSVHPALISLRRTIRTGEQRNGISDGMHIYAFSKGLITTKSTYTHYNPLVTHYTLHSMCISIVLVELKHLLFHLPQHFTALSSTYCTLHIMLSSFSSHLIAVYFLAVLGGMDGWMETS